MRKVLNKYGLKFMAMANGDDYYKGTILIPPDQKDVDINILTKDIIGSVTKEMRDNFGQNMKPEPRATASQTLG